MKRTKVYRPRRGMRFAFGRRGVHPVAGFVGGPAVTRTKPTKPKVNLATRNTDTLTVSGSVMPSLQGPPSAYVDPSRPVVLTSSVYLQGSVSAGRRYEAWKYNAQILGLPQAQVGRRVWPSSAVMEQSMTGTFESPSWTHASVGFNQGFVGVSLSSSFVETKSMNYFLSGTTPLESSPVPASGNLFYAKSQRYQTIVVKNTASFFTTQVPLAGGVPVSGVHVPATFAALTGALINTVTGTNGLHVARPTSPATIFVNVPVSGRLVDIKVWIECAHVSSSGRFYPLGVFGVALRSPNVSWGIAHPLMNDPQVFSLLQGVEFREDDGQVWEFYKDSFLLWEGGNMFGNDTGPMTGTINNGGIAGIFNGGRDTKFYPTWQNDRCMRTVFSDGAPVGNPRMLYASTSPSGNFVGSPNAYNGTGSADALNLNQAYGFDVPWTSDKTIPNGAGVYQQNGSPPAGWLSGPAATAAVNEWPTTGFNFGAPLTRPVYPLLDAIYGKKILGSETTWGGTAFIDTKLFRGFRPGLRGTEISGTWRIMFTNFPVGGGSTFSSTASMDCYYRQARLEITYETPISAEPVIRNSMTRLAPRRAGERFLYRMSGSSGFGRVDFFVNEIYTQTPNQAETGRTYGLTLVDSGTLQGTSALGYRLTGTLADIFGPHPSWLLDRQTGVPAIPLSSASLSPPNSSASLAVSDPLKYLSPTKTLDGARRLEDVATDINPRQTLVQLASAFVSSSAT